jgi:anthranilate phosphoribosyltransferase
VSDAVRAALSTVIEGGTLNRDQAYRAMGSVMDGESTPAQLAALLVALRMRGETVDELAGFASAMRERVVPVAAPAGAMDVVGTGGDGSGTFNISTTAAFIVAAAGVPVAKHGNRAITSRSGSADVLDALGVRIDHDADSAAAALRIVGFAFLFAPGFHLLGPLTNPAGTRRQLVGVGDPAAAPKLAEVLRLLGTERSLVVHGAGVDELPLDGSGVIHDVTPNGVVRREVDVAALGLAPAETARLAGGSPAENAALVDAVLAGTERGPRRDVVLLNAGAALIAAGRAMDLAGGIAQARDVLDSGAASRLVARLRAERLVSDATRVAQAATEVRA